MNRSTRILLAALRIAIGWHFLYEGVWKLTSDNGASSSSTAWYALETSVARLREYFERQPPEAYKLEPALARADAWYDEVIRALKARNMSPSEDQKARLAELRDKVKLAALDASRGAIRPGEVVNFEWEFVRDGVLAIPPPAEGERFTSLPYLQSSAGPFRPLFRGLVRDMDGLKRLTVASAQAAIDERCRQITQHYAAAGRPFDAPQLRRLSQARDSLKAESAATLNAPSFQTRLRDYKLMLQRVEQDAPLTTAPFSRERLAEDRRKLDTISGELLATANEPLAELAYQAETITTVDQMQAGPAPRPGDPARWVDRGISWGLAVTGLFLMLGLLTPLAAIVGACQLALFYMASPPWPGLPAASTGGHFLYIDRNFIELVAVAVVGFAGTGRWSGLDAYLYRGPGLSLPFRRQTQPCPMAAAALKS